MVSVFFDLICLIPTYTLSVKCPFSRSLVCLGLTEATSPFGLFETIWQVVPSLVALLEYVFCNHDFSVRS